MKGKRIVFAVTNDLTYDRRMYRICNTLAESGFDILLIGRKHSHSKEFNPANFTARRFRCLFNKGPLFYAEYNLRLFFILLFSFFQVACACDLDTAPAIRLASWMKRKKSVYDAHEYFSEVPELNERPGVKRIWEWIARHTIPKFDVCYTVGEELASLMGKKYKVHFDVVRNIEPATNRPVEHVGKEARLNILLYQGALNVGRGLEACIDAIAQFPGWQCWLAGEGDITDKLKMRLKALGLEQRITFLGWVKPEDIPALLLKAKININLREKGSLNDYYSLPNKFFDAIHAGLPSINMDYPEYSSICSKFPCSILLEHVDVDKIVSAIRQLDQDPALWESMSQACAQAAEVYNWEKESGKLKEIYSSLIKS